MNDDQQLVSWLAVFAILIAVWFVYREQLSAMLFNTGIGTSSAAPSPNDPSGAEPIQPAAPPAGQSGTFGIDPNGGLYKWLNGQWVPWGDTAVQPGLTSLPMPFSSSLPTVEV